VYRWTRWYNLSEAALGATGKLVSCRQHSPETLSVLGEGLNTRLLFSMANITVASNVSDVEAEAAAVLDRSATAVNVWTPEVVARVSTIVVIMAATMTGNVALITGITCHVALRRRRISVFLVNLAVGDLLVCVFTMTTEILFVAFGQWVLGPAGCKLVVYGQIVTLASTTFLLTAMSIDSYQVLAGIIFSINTYKSHYSCLL